MAKHTPGPWKIAKDTKSRFSVVGPLKIKGADGFTPCHLYGDGRLNPGTANANARLIAAAPDMLAALKMLEQGVDYNSDADCRFCLEPVPTDDSGEWLPHCANPACSINVTRAAIAKADGTE